ncbi:MAG TPA: hypothetical protein VFH78_05340 [Candidatus Thermoplasmatota archaeon]|nr:hypothetical protein [Candidatus Thermoplasmatota archaeon]
MRALLLTLVALLLLAAPTDALPVPRESDGVGPGSKLLIHLDGQFRTACTAAWVWSEGDRLLLGTAGHCVLPEDATMTHGPRPDFDPARVHVLVCVDDCEWGGYTGIVLLRGRAEPLGPLVYARQGGQGLDFALLEIPPALHALVRPGMTTFGTPTYVQEVQQGNLVCVQGRSVGVGESHAGQSRAGVGLGSTSERWWAAYPGAYGDSGAAIATCKATPQGLRAVGASGIVTQLSPYLDRPGLAGTTMARAAELARDAGLDIQPLLGTGA